LQHLEVSGAVYGSLDVKGLMNLKSTLSCKYDAQTFHQELTNEENKFTACKIALQLTQSSVATSINLRCLMSGIPVTKCDVQNA